MAKHSQSVTYPVFRFESRGEIEAKGKIKMYFVVPFGG